MGAGSVWKIVGLHLETGQFRTREEPGGWPQWLPDSRRYVLNAAGLLAPLIVKDKVIVGTAGGDGRIRGYIAAFDAATGKQVWRFSTIPAPGEPGNETWAGESWKMGGAGVWNTGTYDADLNLTYWGTGNPFPVRSGRDPLRWTPSESR